MSKFTKQQILDAMSQTAKDGKPLGQARFEAETGIGPYDWGEYWSLFSKLQKEAGFEPNQPSTRCDDGYLVKQMIAKIRKFKRYPTLGEMRIEKNTDPDFPYTIIKNRKKPYIVKIIIKYCEKREVTKIF